MTIRLVLADDHPVVLDGLGVRLGMEAGIEVVATCCDGFEAIEAVVTHDPDVLVLDHHMPECTGVETLGLLRAQGSEVPVVLLSASLEDDDLLEALHHGRVAVVLKEAPSAQLVGAIRSASEERFALSGALLARVLERAESTPGSASMWPELTPRESDVVALVAEGSSNKRIARDLGIVEGTVKMHLHSIFRKLNLSNRVQLAALAFQRDTGGAPSTGPT